MGNIWQRLLSRYNKDARILMVGLDAAGKTTALYKLKLGEVITTVPTIGFNVENVQYNGSKFVTWDVSGRDKIRPLWRHYLQNTDVLIFVIDSNDRERISECKEELWKLLRGEKLNNMVVLVMANKQDLPNAMSVEEISQELELEKIQHQMIHVQGTCAISGDGLHESLSWVQTTLAQRALKKPTVKPIKEVLTQPTKS